MGDRRPAIVELSDEEKTRKKLKQKPKKLQDDLLKIIKKDEKIPVQKLALKPIFAGTPMHAQDIDELLHSVKRFVERRSNYVNNIENMLAKALDMEVNSNICTVSQVRTRASEI